MTPLLVALKRSDRPAARIMCFPYAGGRASYTATWSRHLPYEVELFGVGYPSWDAAQTNEQRTVQDIAAAVLQEVLVYCELPLILFGYSLGALVAYEVSVELARRAAHLPSELVVAAHSAPHIKSKQGSMAHLPEPEFIARLRELGGTPSAVLDNPDILSFFLPLLRADIATAEAYQPSAAPPLSCPISAITGNADATTEPETVAAWERYTNASFQLHRLAGDHFFLHEQQRDLINIVAAIVRRRAVLPVMC